MRLKLQKNVWRDSSPNPGELFLRTRINDRIAQVEEDLKRQEKEKEEIEGLKFEIGNLETRLRGETVQALRTQARRAKFR